MAPVILLKELLHGELTEKILAAAIEVHRHLGPGLLESAYRDCLAYELERRGHGVQREMAIPLVYKGLHVQTSYRIDLIVDRKVIVEIKVVKSFEPVHHAQLLTYLRFTSLRLGLLLNFNLPTLREGVRRVVL
jgi:GxxExxY protein